jgi:2-polyprenyl-3-methyl-5-hydroxy-6-metoxy-1,4-benzoquinol methylase
MLKGSARRSTAQFFDRYARDFDAIYGTPDTVLNRLVNRYLRRSMLLRYQKTLAGCQPIGGRTVADIGCGPGHYAVALARQGARHVWGVDFAPAMITLAREHAAQAGVAERCTFVVGDFLRCPVGETYDYAIVMGVLDYVAEPRQLIAKVLEVTRGAAFFSLPVAGGLLAWQRKLRYRRRCDLFLYREDQVRDIFTGLPYRTLDIERIDRDLFVTCRVS